ncbi:hypothetical protein lbkm_3379 [Lachnospiraceae bacterium KM106-2]|nr:hypothetical protein lbkm_3379 [Lachnospiraceae bacterium KM106-2]
MADYKRLVSYMYRYENNTKCNNIGYARIETRNGQCKITIHIKTMHHSNLPIHVYMYLWIRGKMICISLGEIQIRNGVGDFKSITNSGDLMESGFRLDEMSGILVYVSDTTFFGTEWDDQSINCTGLRIVKRKEDLGDDKYETFEKAEGQKEEDALMQFDDVVLGAAEIEATEEKEEEPVVEEQEVQTEMQQKEEESTETEEEQIDKLDLEAEKSFEEVIQETESDADVKACEEEENIDQNENNTSQEEIHKVEIDPIKSYEFLTGFKRCETDQEEEEIKVQIQQLQEQILHLQSIIDEYHDKQLEAETEEENTIAAESLNQEDCPVVTRIFEHYPKLEPFNDELVEKCVKIEPQDIGIFPMENWILANNSFLLHGYYSYRHLIFAKLNDDNKVHYILGVPGVNHTREKNMAEMFGFKKFQKIKDADHQDGEFGYWCLDINFK